MTVCGYSVFTVLFLCVGVFIASFIDAIGGGGGLISFPVYLIAGLPTHFALGTNKLSSCLGTTASTFRYIKNGYFNLRLAIPSVVLAIGGAYLGTSLQLMLDETYLRYLLVVVLLIVAPVMLKKKTFEEFPGEIPANRQAVIALAAAFFIGAYDGFYGPGSGTFLLIVFCRLAKMGLREASGNVKIVNLSSNIGSLVTSLLAGKVLIALGLITAVFAFLGQFLGAGMMMKKGTKIVTPVILTVLGLLLVKTVLELFGITL